MGTKWVFVWEPSVGTTVDNNQIFDAIRHSMIFFRAVQEDYWRSTFSFVDLTQPFIRDQSQAALDQPHIPVISLAQEPFKYYLLLHENIIFETNLSSVTSQKKVLGYNFEGFQYRLGNNTLKLHVGRVIHDRSRALKTVFMEVDYLNSFSIESTRNLMEYQIQIWQLIASIMSWPGQFVQIDSKYAEYGMSDIYTPQHTVLQYCAVINRLKLGTKWVFVWEPDVCTPVNNYIFNEIFNKSFNDICRYLESTFNIVKETSWRSTVMIVEPSMADQSQACRVFIRLMEEPNKHYLIQSNLYKIFEVDDWMIMAKKESKSFLFEGFKYQLGELQLLVGRVTDKRNGALKTVFMELDFLHNFSTDRTRNHMEQQFNMWNQIASEQSWQGRFVQIHLRQYAKYGLSDIYTPQHTALQYYAVMAHIFAFYHRRCVGN